MSRNDGGTWGIIHGYCAWKSGRKKRFMKDEEDFKALSQCLLGHKEPGRCSERRK